MYTKSAIKNLSEKQLSKLLNGHAVRVQFGSGLNVQLSPEQHKKLMKAHAKQKGMTIRFDPYQLLNHGHLRKSGIGRMAKKLMGGNLTATAKDGAKNVITAGSDRAVRAIEGSGVSRTKKFTKWTKTLGSAAKSVGKYIAPVAKPILEAATNRAVNEITTYGDPVAELDNVFDTFYDNIKPALKTKTQQMPQTQQMTMQPQYSYYPQPVYASPYNPQSFNQYDYQNEVIATPYRNNQTLYYGGKLRKPHPKGLLARGRRTKSKKGGALYVAGPRPMSGSALFPA